MASFVEWKERLGHGCVNIFFIFLVEETFLYWIQQICFCIAYSCATFIFKLKTIQKRRYQRTKCSTELIPNISKVRVNDSGRFASIKYNCFPKALVTNYLACARVLYIRKVLFFGSVANDLRYHLHLHHHRRPDNKSQRAQRAQYFHSPKKTISGA